MSTNAGTARQSASAGASPPTALSLEQAIELAEAKSEQVAVAEAGVARAKGEQVRAKSERFPQLTASASYDRTLNSEFEGLFDQTNANGEDGGVDFGRLPFGRKNIWRVNLQFTQSLFTGGRVAAQERIAATGEVNAALTLTAARAQLALDVVRAYYDAVLSERIVAIAQQAYAQAEATYQQTRLQREAGTQPEFELLRAQVARDNQGPTLIRRRSEQRLALLRLKQLLELPAGAPLDLTTRLDDDVLPPPARFAPALANARTTVSGKERVPMAAAENVMRIRQESVTVAHAQRFPTVSATSSYGRVNYPANFFPDFGDFRTNWTIGAQVQVPILTGGRIRADEMIARAAADEARAALQQTRELVELDTQSAFEELESADASWQASGGTVQQAVRAYEIADLRYRQGISTQLELSDARLLLAQAQANRAQAARDLQVARARVALLPDLPIATTGAATGIGSGVTSTLPAEPDQRQQTPAQTPTMRAAQASGGSIQQ